ncbi:MAG: dihydroorotase [Muribaculaceae bacterium]|nr:dihydroorotase [Muribaculaceae bacterium]
MKSFWLLNAKIFCNNDFVEKNIFISEGIIKILSDSKPKADSYPSYDLTGKIVIPSLVDMHVHLREPGFSYKETINAGSLAAAAGGFSTVCTMPNLNPTPDSIENLKIQLDIIRRDAHVQVIPFAAITKGRMGKELVDYEALAPFVAGFSDDGSGVQNLDIMKKAMERISKTGKILAAHCEVESLLEGGYIHKGTYAKKYGHPGISSESEWKEVERDIILAEETGCRLHICHISTKESVELVRQAKKNGIDVTCETGPHYLTFSDQDLKDEGRFKMNPPIRGIEDREALREGLIDGTIDVIATDHAPHSMKEKSRGLQKSAMGVVGLETAFPAVYTTMVSSGLMSLQHLIKVMALNPRKILHLPQDTIETGNEANITVIDINDSFIVDPENFKSLGKATPYEGLELKSKILMTIYNGKPVFNALL